MRLISRPLGLFPLSIKGIIIPPPPLFLVGMWWKIFAFFSLPVCVYLLQNTVIQFLAFLFCSGQREHTAELLALYVKHEIMGSEQETEDLLTV